jgi:Fur family iron response transcriptional regulator
MKDIIAKLRKHKIQPTPQRIAVAGAILRARIHASADEIWKAVKKSCPTISRATVYNTLNLLVEKKILKTQIIKEGKVVYDPCIEPHHHFIDEETGEIHDVPWSALKVSGESSLPDFEVLEYQVVMRGRKKKK